MRILFVTHHALPHIGGIERLAQMEVDALLRRGHEVVWVTSALSSKDSTEGLDHPGLTLHRVPAWHGIERRWLLAFPIFSPTIWGLLQKEVKHCDAVRGHGFVFLNVVLALLAGHLAGKQTLLTDHGGELKYPSRIATDGLWLAIQTLGKLSVTSSRRSFAYNQRIFNLLKRLAREGDSVEFLPNPIDRSKFFPASTSKREQLRRDLGWNPERKVVLFIGRLVMDKGVDRLLAAKQDGFDLCCCGPAEDPIIEKVVQAGAEYLPPRELPQVVELYQAADLLALPSWNEGFPVVIQEALACGLPVLTTNDPGYAPYAGHPGLYFVNPEPELFGKQLASLLENSQEELYPAIDVPRDTESLLGEIDPWLERIYGDSI
ncbi:GDP-mannose-dependent monoacylated alpha-(1-6)-phosphatidylinositol monomannoside mannosyltransferase [Planctomycetales bacterium 10988]|nr:GDP-mannose-dependent monoacylated alpha-(1-6)-phosphatidylinositol monomannoside mannosyltransferase [Planctomycetales bacterium 10988]